MSALVQLLQQLEQDNSLDRADRLRERLDALDRLEAYADFEVAAHDGMGGAVRGAATTGDPQRIDEPGLPVRADAMRRRLEAANAAFYAQVRRAIRRGEGAQSLRELAAGDGTTAEIVVAGGDRYDHLDALVSGILQFAEPAAEIAELEAEMVFFQPTPARHIFDLFRRMVLTEHDVLVDLGSGLGHVPLLTAICTRAHSIGIEREAAYVDCARRSALELNLEQSMFVCKDARAADFSTGTVFYLYTPFSGAILRDVLDALRRQAAERGIRVCTYGPCTPVVAAEDWLEAIGAVDAGRITVFRSRDRARART